jgi:nucleoid DNA-binding protein
MTRTEVIESMANRTGMDKKEVKKFLEDLTMLIEETIRAGG